MDLIKEIQEAFKDRKRPSTANLCRTGDDEGVSEHFYGTKWQEHDAECLRNHSVALTFFNPEAFCYYLPAFLIESLKNKDLGSWVPDALCPPKNDPTRTSYSNWWSMLSLKQKRVIIAYLRSFDNEYSLAYEAAADALERAIGE